MSKNKSRVLPDHKIRKKKLIPPLIDAMQGKHAPFSWTKQLVPELIWIALIHHTLGFKRGIVVAEALGTKASELYSEHPKPSFCKLSEYSFLSGAKKKKLLEELNKAGVLQDLQKSLSPIFHFFKKSPLKFLCPTPKDIPIRESDAQRTLSTVLPKMYDRYSRTAAVSTATAVYITGLQGKLHIAAGLGSPLDNLNHIFQYPDTQESKALASSLRAMVPMLLLKGEDEGKIQDEWSIYFWRQISKVGKCEVSYQMEVYDVSLARDEISKIALTFCNDARREFQERIDKWKFNLNDAESYEVIGGLLARQTSLATDLAFSPMSWTPSTAPLFLRAMADVYITLMWLLKSPKDRAIKYIEHGIGSVKLEIAHRKKFIEGDKEPDPVLVKMLELYEDWLASQRIEDLVEVDLGNWSGMTTREMAKGADCLDFYNYVYQPFSDAVHSAWRHVSMHNLQTCENHIHRFHKIPTCIDFPADPYWLYLAGKYLQKAFVAFDQKMDISVKSRSAYDELYNALYNKNIGKKMSKDAAAASI